MPELFNDCLGYGLHVVPTLLYTNGYGQIELEMG